ncbi:MAG: hypothetical protein Q9207_008287 [Kuettlingeria erythrocarpa]
MCPLIVGETMTSRSQAKRIRDSEDSNLDFEPPIKRHCVSDNNTSGSVLSCAPRPNTALPNPVAHMFSTAAHHLRQSAPEASAGVRVQHNLVTPLMLADLRLFRESRNSPDDTICPQDTNASSDPPEAVEEAGGSSKSSNSTGSSSSDPPSDPPTATPDTETGTTSIPSPSLTLRGGRASPVPRDLILLREPTLLKLRYGDPRIPLSGKDHNVMMAQLREMRALVQTGDREVRERQRAIVRLYYLRVERDREIKAAEVERVRRLVRGVLDELMRGDVGRRFRGRAGDPRSTSGRRAPGRAGDPRSTSGASRTEMLVREQGGDGDADADAPVGFGFEG